MTCTNKVLFVRWLYGIFLLFGCVYGQSGFGQDRHACHDQVVALTGTQDFKKQEKHIDTLVQIMMRLPAEQMDPCLRHLLVKIPDMAHAKQNLMRIQWGLSDVFRQRNRLEVFSLYALEAARQYQDPDLEALAYYTAADAYYKSDHLDSARQYFEHTLRTTLPARLPDICQISIYNSLGLICRKKGQYEEAIEYFRQAFTISSNFQNAWWPSICQSNIAQIYYLQGEYTKAQDILRTVLPVLAQDTLWDGGALLIMANIHREQRQFEEALYLLDSASRQLQRHRAIHYAANYETYMRLYRAYTDLYADMGRFEDAYRTYRLFDAYADTVTHQQRSKEMIRMQENYDIEYRNEQIKAAHEQNARYIAQRNGLIIAFGIGLAGLAAVLYQFMRANRLNRKLDEQADELRTSNQIKDKLFSIIAHDLRSPFSTMQGMLHLLRMGMLSEEEKERILTTIEQQCGYTADMLDSLLIWARRQISEARQIPQPSVCKAEQLIGEAVQTLRIRAEEKSIQLLHQPGPQLYVWADPDHIRIVLRNFIANAIKFTPEYGMIIIGSEDAPVGQWVRFFVQDSGTGMSIEEQQALMDPARHFSKRGTAGEKGTGLGLLLCQDFVQANGGYIEIQSQVGEGSTFAFYLPAASPDQPMGLDQG